MGSLGTSAEIAAPVTQSQISGTRASSFYDRDTEIKVD